MHCTKLARFFADNRIIAECILPRVSGGRECPDRLGEVVFDAEEGPVAGIVTHPRSPPETPLKLSKRVRRIAGLGGFLGRQHDAHPSPKALWEGMQKVSAFAIAFKVRKAAYAEDG